MFTKRLKDLRNAKGLTQRELAKELNLSNGTIAMYETDKRSPDKETLEILANFFEVSVDFLLGRTDDSTPYRDVNSDLDAERDFDKELADLLKDEDMAMFHDYAHMDDDDKKAVIDFIKGRKLLKEDKKENG